MNEKGSMTPALICKKWTMRFLMETGFGYHSSEVKTGSYDRCSHVPIWY